MSLPRRSKNVLSFVGRFSLSAVLMWYLFTKVDVAKTVSVIRSADLSILFCSFAVFLIVNFILLYRWFIFIKAFDLTVSIWHVCRFFFIGLFGNLFLPSSIGGDLIKIIGLCKDSHQKPRVVASVILDRLSGFLAIVLVGVGSFIFGFQFIGDSSLLWLIVAMGGGLLAVCSILFNERIYSFCCSVFNFLPKVKDKLMEMHYDISLLRGKPGIGPKVIGVACFSQLVFIFSFFLIAKALHQDISFIYFLIFVPLICISSFFPSIGGLGVREFGAAYLFAKVGVESGIAMSMSLMTFVFMVIVGLIGGGIYVFTFSSGRVQHHSSDAGVDSSSS